MTTPTPPRRRFRYSLRTLFGVVAMFAIGSYWLAMPTILAQKFLRAIEEEDYAQAATLFVPRDEQHPYRFPIGIKNDPAGRKPRVTLKPLTFDELTRGIRTIHATVPSGWNSDSLNIWATRNGLVVRGGTG